MIGYDLSINQAGDKAVKQEKVYIQIQCPVEVRDQAHKVALYQGVSISDVLREHVKKKYKALPEEAK